MSHLASGLVNTVLKDTPLADHRLQKDGNTIKYLERESLTILRDSKASRVNQFNVDDRILGLEEKFKILNNQELADALHEKVEELSRWDKESHHELLALLLDLSDSPVTKTRIEDLELLKKTPPLPQLTWTQVLADDPPDSSQGIWRTIDYAEESSEEDEAVTTDYTVESPAKPASLCPDNLDPAEFPSDYNITIEHALTRDLAELQFWRTERDCLNEPADTLLTETQMIREILFMLMQIPTSVFQISHHGQIRMIRRYRIQRISSDALEDIITTFTSIGQELAKVRDWVSRAQTMHMLQTLQAILRNRLQDIVALLTEVEARLLHPEFQAPVTLLSLLFEVQIATRPILLIGGIIHEHQPGLTGKPFAVLESVYEGICFAESTGDEDVYRFFGEVFFPCLGTYLKPVSEWIEFGELRQDDKEFFIMRNEKEPSRESLWSDQYMLLYNPNGTLHAPAFLHVRAQKILTSGKSVSFVRSLGLETPAMIQRSSYVPPIDFESICGLDHADTMRPFSERLDSALNAWVNDKHQVSSVNLRDFMASRYGLWRVLDAIEYIFLSRNGALTSQVVSGISSRIDKGKIAWDDKFILTELFREAFGVLGCVNTAQVFVRSNRDKGKELLNRQRTMGSLACLEVGYKLPWVIANVIRPDSENVYQRVFILLLQVLRAKELLSLKAPGPLSTGNDDRNTVAIALFLRHRLLWFINTLHSYLTTTVLSQTCSEFRAKMEKADDLDAMIAAHEMHVHRLEGQCLLSTALASTHQAIVSMLDLVVLFSDLQASMRQQSAIRVDSIPKNRRDTLEASSDIEDGDTPIEPVDMTEDGQQPAKLRRLPLTFSRLLGFILAGLREASRSGVETCWGILMEELAIGERN
ncbi:hypothetical protein MMC11_000773 [Xylographa trunciseda]|nr:hypothetical protein [Xylographa trunciseda]